MEEKKAEVDFILCFKHVCSLVFSFEACAAAHTDELVAE